MSRADSSFCDPTGKTGFCSPTDEGPNYAALFTERAQKEEGIELGEREGSKVPGKTYLLGWLKKEMGVLGPATATSGRTPFLSSSYHPTNPDLGLASGLY